VLCTERINSSCCVFTHMMSLVPHATIAPTPRKLRAEQRACGEIQLLRKVSRALSREFSVLFHVADNDMIWVCLIPRESVSFIPVEFVKGWLVFVDGKCHSIPISSRVHFVHRHSRFS
jgi:hypothetical protein